MAEPGDEERMQDVTLQASHQGARGSLAAAEAVVLAGKRYVPLAEVARGGGGRILRARDVVFDRIVALKVPIDPEASARVRAEAAILATLQHPSIMPVYDTGVFEDGTPFFAMKLVEGRSLRDAIADAPTLDQRLALVPFVIAVTEAMSYAHARSILHRDLKPGNVLVGAFGEVIVIDWGLAKRVTGGTDAEASGREPAELPGVVTRTGAVMGTPAYMAPEQALGEPVDVRADVYALGAMLYHLLAGAPPFSDHAGKELLERVATSRLDPIENVQRRVPVDLAAIIAKAMARAPAARYPSAQELAADLLRFQAGGLVRARRYTWLARARRTGRKHAGKLAAGALAAASATAAILSMPSSAETPGARCERSGERVASIWQPVRAAVLRGALTRSGRANAAETAALVSLGLDRYADAWRTARVDACKATYVRGEQSESLFDLRMACLDRRLGEMNALVGALVERPTPEVTDKAVEATAKLPPLASCEDTTALQAVVPLPADPDVRRRITDLRADLARAVALDDLGRYHDGRALANEVARQSQQLAYPPLEVEALHARAQLEDRDGDAKAAEATLRTALLAGAAAHDDVLVARIWADLVQVVGYALARPDEALAMRGAAEVALRRAGDPSDPQIRLWTNLAKVYLQQTKLPEAAQLLERARTVAEDKLGPDDLRVGSLLGPLAAVAVRQGDYKLASKYGERAVSICEKVLGSEHPMLAQALNNLAEIVRNMDQLDRALEYHRRALAIRERTLGPQHPSLATTLHNLAIVEREARQLDSARSHLERALAIREAVLGLGHRDTSDTLLMLGNVRQAQGALEEARRLYERALEAQTASLGPDHPHLFYVLTNLGKLALQQDRFADARRDYVRAVELVRKGRGPDHRELAFPLIGLAKALVELGRASEASAAASEALAIRVKRGEPAQLVAEARFVRSRALWLLGERRQARELAEEARRGYVDSGDADARGEIAEIDAWLSVH